MRKHSPIIQQSRTKPRASKATDGQTYSTLFSLYFCDFSKAKSYHGITGAVRLDEYYVCKYGNKLSWDAWPGGPLARIGHVEGDVQYSHSASRHSCSTRHRRYLRRGEDLWSSFSPPLGLGDMRRNRVWGVLMTRTTAPPVHVPLRDTGKHLC